MIKFLLLEGNNDAITATPATATPSTSSLLSLPSYIRKSMTILPLHPLMMTSDSVPDYTRKAPHPCLLFRIPRSVFMNTNNNNNI